MSRRCISVYLTIGLLVISQALLADPIKWKALNLATSEKNCRLLFDFSSPVAANIVQTGPRRLAITLPNTELAANLKQPPADHALVRRITTEKVKDGLRVGVELKKIGTSKHFTDNKGRRLVLELAQANSKPANAHTSASEPATPRQALRSAPSAKTRVVAIDAGHGGKDTGAIGPNGLREKDVVYAIAKRLADFVQAEPNMRAVLVRKGDHFIELRQRAEIARKARADLFVSLHADAYINGDARGSSVFTLSRHGASSVAARWLADRENAADLVGGVKLKDKDKVLAGVLLDLSQTAAIEASDHAAVKVLRELQKSHHLHQNQIQKAGFVVLKSPDIPSLLVETAFISNPEEERKLATERYQTLIARSIFNGIRAYFASKSRVMAPPSPPQPDGKPVIVAVDE